MNSASGDGGDSGASAGETKKRSESCGAPLYVGVMAQCPTVGALHAFLHGLLLFFLLASRSHTPLHRCGVPRVSAAREDDSDDGSEVEYGRLRAKSCFRGNPSDTEAYARWQKKFVS